MVHINEYCLNIGENHNFKYCHPYAIENFNDFCIKHRIIETCLVEKLVLESNIIETYTCHKLYFLK